MSARSLADLAPLYNGLKDGEFSWADVIRSKEEPAEGDGKTPAPEGRKPLKDRIMKEREAAKPEPPEPGAGK